MSEVQATEVVETTDVKTPGLILDIVKERNDIIETFRASDRSEEATILAIDAAIGETLKITEGTTGLKMDGQTLTGLADMFFSEVNS